MGKRLYIRSFAKGYAHPKCYLSHTNGCDTKITGEHCISHNLLNKIESVNKTVDVIGLSWLPKDQMTSVGKKALVSNVLCYKHNSELSPLDSAIGTLVEAISRIDAAFLEPDPAALHFKIDGDLVERWIIKTALCLVYSGQIKLKTDAPYVVKPECGSLLCVPHARWPDGWGLYVARPAGKIYHSSSFEIMPKHDPATGELAALGLKLNGIEMNFLMGRPDHRGSFGEQRPAALVFRKGDLRSTIEIRWPRRKAGKAMLLTHQGSYTGPSPDHPPASAKKP